MSFFDQSYMFSGFCSNHLSINECLDVALFIMTWQASLFFFFLNWTENCPRTSFYSYKLLTTFFEHFCFKNVSQWWWTTVVLILYQCMVASSREYWAFYITILPVHIHLDSKSLCFEIHWVGKESCQINKWCKSYN